MASSDASDPSGPFVPTQPGASAGEFERLFAEINALSLLVKRATNLQYPQGELSASERTVLQILEASGPQTVPQIARARSTSRQNIQILVNRLAGESCVKTMINPGHKRSVLLGLTVEGRALLRAAEQQQSKLTTKLEPVASWEELRAAVRVLRQFRALLEDQEGAAGPASRPALPKTKSRPIQPEPVIGLSEEAQSEDLSLPVNLL